MKFTTIYSNDVIIIAGESEVSQTSNPDGNTKTKPSGDVCSYVDLVVLWHINYDLEIVTNWGWKYLNLMRQL